ncbi:MAG: Uma2 family endonuclease [Dehalococcoidia bacterium]
MRRFTVDEYHRMGEAGIFHPDERTELIAGEVIVMPPIGPPHNFLVLWLARFFWSRAGDRYVVSTQGPVRLARDWEPQPDLMLLRPPADRYRAALPGPEDVLLVIEVSDTTLLYDRRTKLPRYAAAGIPEAWIVNLTAACIEVARDPTPAGYTTTSIVGRGGMVAPRAFPDALLPVADIVG